MNSEILLTLKLDNRLFADPRRIVLLKQVAISGSISQGAKLAGISYKSAWDAINEMNHLADKIVVERATGGKGGGGATLTKYGQRLIQLYDLLAQIQRKAFDVLKEDSLPLDSLLAAISRFSLQTSARNQFFGKVDKLSGEAILEQVEIVLNDGKTRLKAALTGQSAERLQLSSGKEVLVLIKAPWITLTTEIQPAADNVWQGVISSIQSGDKNSEVLLQLDGGEQLCVTVANQQLPRLSAKLGMSIKALFSAESVIIAALL